MDLTESISVLLDPIGNILRFEVVGFLDIQSAISGLPDISLKFIDSSRIGTVGFHNCVRYSKWDKERVVSFIPPDGPFRLMSYRATPAVTNSLPVTIKPTVTVGHQGGSFTFLISSTVPLARLAIRWQLGRLATGIISEQLQCRARDGRRIEPSWEWNETKKEICWHFGGDDVNCCLTGLWTHRTIENEPNHSIRVEFESKVQSPNLSFVGLKIDKIDIQKNVFHHAHSQPKDSNHPFPTLSSSNLIHKGVKMKFKSGQYEIRW